MLMGQLFKGSEAPLEIKSGYLLAYGKKDISGEPAVITLMPDGYPGCYMRAGDAGEWVRMSYTIWEEAAGEIVWFDRKIMEDIDASQRRWKDELYPASFSIPCGIFSEVRKKQGEKEYIPITKKGSARLELVTKEITSSYWVEPPCYDKSGASAVGHTRRGASHRTVQSRVRATEAVGNCLIRLWLDDTYLCDRPYLTSLFWLKHDNTRNLCAPIEGMLNSVVRSRAAVRIKDSSMHLPSYPSEQWLLAAEPEDCRQMLGHALGEMEYAIRDKKPAVVVIKEGADNVAFLSDNGSWGLACDTKAGSGTALKTTRWFPLKENPEVFTDNKNLVRLDVSEEIWKNIDAKLVMAQI